MAVHQQTPDFNALLPIVQDYAERRRWQVLPLRQHSKEPATKRGLYDATSNVDTLRRYFKFYPYNIGIRTGIASRIFILDLDGHAGAISLGQLEHRHGPLPATLISTTADGCHFWFHTDQPIPSSTGKIGAGVDVRGDGAYVVAPPSIHPDGPVYRWRNSLPPVPAPEWLLQLISKRPPSPPLTAILPRPRQPNSSAGAYAAAALQREVDDVARAAPGTRNHVLNRASFSLHQLVAGGELDGNEVEQRLFAAAEANGLIADPADGPRRVQATIRSGRRAGLQNPRNRQGRI
jgi:hypothetical protein